MKKKESVDMSLLSRLGNVVFSLSIPKFIEANQWLKSQMMQLDDHEAEMRLLLVAIENLTKQRKEMIISYQGLINSLELYIDAGKEVEEPLATECQHLATALERAKIIHEKIDLCDMKNLNDTFDEYTRTINSIRLAYTQRQHCFNAWKLAEKEARNRQMAVENDKSLVSALRQSQQDAFATQKKFTLATETLVDELRQWEVSRGDEIKQVVRCYTEAMIKGHQELLKIWRHLLKKTGEGNGKNEF
jgi:sorting nexin-1/2